jgi:hypothetical protein
MRLTTGGSSVFGVVTPKPSDSVPRSLAPVAVCSFYLATTRARPRISRCQALPYKCIARKRHGIWVTEAKVLEVFVVIGRTHDAPDYTDCLP